MNNLCFFVGTKANWGDHLNPVLYEYLSGKKPNIVPFTSKEPTYYMIGSILDAISNENSYIYGTGFMFNKGRIIISPKEVYAVRGKLTAAKLRRQGIQCPEVYGDPALLIPMYYDKKIQRKYKLGIVPHYADYGNQWLSKVTDKDILIIDPCLESHQFIDRVRSCEMVASSSLHGVICADAYGIPSLWIEFLDGKVVGEGFKFHDYYSGVGRQDIDPFIISEHVEPRHLEAGFTDSNIRIDLKKLHEACPFKK